MANWQAIIGESRTLGDRQETSVTFTDGTRKFTRSFVNDGSLAALKPTLIAASQQTDTFETTKAKNELVPGTVIDLTPPVVVPPTPDPTADARAAFQTAYRTYRSLLVGLSLSLGTLTQADVDAALANVQKAYQPGYELLLGGI